MGLGKIIGINILIFAVLNFLFMVLLAVAGGVGGVSIGEFFGLITTDIGGFFTALFTLGGTSPDVFSGFWSYLMGLLNPADPHIAQYVVGMLWVLLPGMIAGIIAGKSYANESSKDAFWGVFVSMMVMAALPLILAAVPIFGIFGGSTISQYMVSPIYYTMAADGSLIWSLGAYFVPLVIGLFNAIFFAGIAAASSSNL